MSTVRKNSKEFRAALELKGWTMRNLDNCFRGEDVQDAPKAERVNKMTKDGNVLTIDIHSNLWYTKTI